MSAKLHIGSREREREESRADNYNAYHKLAVAVAEVWGLAIPKKKYAGNFIVMSVFDYLL